MNTPRTRIRAMLTLAVAFGVATGGMARASETVWVGAIEQGLTAPMSLAVDGDRIAVLEPYARQIVIFSTDGLERHRLDIHAKARALARLDASVYLFCDPEGGVVMAADITTGATWIFTDAASEPVDIVVNAAHVYVLDASGRILVTDAEGSLLSEIPLNGPGESPLASPASLVRDAARDRFHVLDQTTSTVTTFAANGARLTSFCSFGTGPGEISRGGEIGCDSEGYVYVCDRYQGRVVVFDEAGEFVAHMDPLDLDQDRLALPTGIALDANDLLYVASTESRQIQLLYLDKLGSSATIALAHPVHPADEAVVVCEDLRLVAEIELPVGATVPSGADFRLLLDEDTNRVLAEATDVPITAVDDGSGALVAEWWPPLTCVVGTRYSWQVRVRSGVDPPEWSPLRSFIAQGAGPMFQLGQNYPNPFTPRTTIPFRAPANVDVRVRVIDVQGRVVWSETMANRTGRAGEISWDGRNTRRQHVASGVYFYRLEAGDFVAIRKLVLVR